MPSLDEGLSFYATQLGLAEKWRNDEVGQAGLSLPDGATELVLTTKQRYEPNWLVDSVDTAVEKLSRSGATLLRGPDDIPVGKVAVVEDPFGNELVLVDLSKGEYPATGDVGPSRVGLE